MKKKDFFNLIYLYNILSVIRENLGNFTYKIEDSLKDVETVHREDIISNQDSENDSFEVTFFILNLLK